MNPGGNKSSNEILTGKPDETIKISTLQDLKIALGKDIPDGIKEIEKPITVSKNEIQDLKKQILGKGNPEILGSIRGFLENKRKSVFDNTKETIKAFKEGKGHTEQNERNKNQKENENNINDVLNSISKKTKQVRESQVGTQTKEVFHKAKDVASAGMGMNWETLEKIPLIGWIFKILGNLFGSLKKMFNIGDKIEKILDMGTPEYKKTLEETQNKIISRLEEKSGRKLKPEEKEKIKEKLNPNNKGSYLDADAFQELSKKAQSGEGVTMEDIKTSGILGNLMSDPELKDTITNIAEKAKEEMFVRFKQKLQKSGIDVNEGSENDSKLRAIINRRINESTLKKVKEKQQLRFGEGLIIGYETGTFIPSVLLELWEENIISGKNLVIGAAEKGTNKVKIGLKSLSGENIVPDLVGEIPFGMFNEQIKDLGLDKKTILLRAFYSELGLIAGVLGQVGYYGSSLLVSSIEMGVVGGKNVAKGSLGNIKTQPLQGLSKTIQGISAPPVKQLQSTLEILQPGSGLWLDDIKSSLKLTKNSYEVLEEMKTASPERQKVLSKKLGNIHEEIDSIKNSGKVGIRGKGLKSTSQALKNPLQYYYHHKTMEDIHSITQANKTLGQSILNGTLGKTIDHLRNIKNSWRLRYIGGHATIHLANKLEASKFSQALIKLSPEIIKTAFGRLPIILVGRSFYAEAIKEDGDLFTAIKASNGFLGGWSLLQEGVIDFKSGGFKLEGAGKGTLGMVVIGTELYFFTKDTFKYIGKHSNLGYGKVPVALGRAAFNSAVRIPLEMVKVGGWGIARAAEFTKIGGALLKNAPKKGKIGAGVAIVAGALYLAKNATANEIDINNMEENDYFKDGETNIEHIKRDFQSLDDDKKEEIFSVITILNFPEKFKDKQDSFHFSLKNNTYKIEVEPKLLENNKAVFDQINQSLSEFSYEINAGINVIITQK